MAHVPRPGEECRPEEAGPPRAQLDPRATTVADRSPLPELGDRSHGRLNWAGKGKGTYH